MAESLAEALGLPQLPEPYDDFEVAKAAPLTFHQDDHVKDYETVRQTAYDLLAKGNQALEILLAKAAASDSSRPFEVVATLMKTMSEINYQLLDMHSKYAELNAELGKKHIGHDDGDDDDELVEISVTEMLARAKSKTKT